MTCISIDLSRSPKILNFLFIFDPRLLLWPTNGELPNKKKKTGVLFVCPLMQGAGVFKISDLTGCQQIGVCLSREEGVLLHTDAGAQRLSSVTASFIRCFVFCQAHHFFFVQRASFCQSCHSFLRGCGCGWRWDLLPSSFDLTRRKTSC